MILGHEFYNLPATEVAPLLCGKLIFHKTDGGEVLSGRITEVECYFGEEDSACHAHRGKTKRNAVLYHEGGVAYVYLCYGIHELLNVVTGDENHPEAVLIRGIEGAPGPGLTTKALCVTRAENGISLITSGTLWIEDDGYKPDIEYLPRVGIDYADKADRERLWRMRCNRQIGEHK
ncbi:MAG: DNA-3-methyladenine glycosylase [Clostridia bacterium]|nr:DNA-3-methyladenine glycosylase [Clostridia bacterium]